MRFDLTSAIRDHGTWLSVAAVLFVFASFYISRYAIQLIYQRWPFGKIKALRDNTKSGDRWAGSMSTPASHVRAREQVVRRLDEATNALAEQIIRAKINGIFANVANFAQGIIGVVMLTYYIRSTVSLQSVGVWGVIVLSASLFKRVYSPDVLAEKAEKNADRLEVLLRYSQDQLSALDARSTNGQDRTDALITLTDQISSLVAEIINPGADVPTPPSSPEPLAPVASPPAPATSSATDETPINAPLKQENPRLVVSYGPLKKEGEGFEGAIGVILTNVGGTEAHRIRLGDVVLTQKVIEFPENISVLPAGEHTHAIAGRVTEYGPLQMFDIARAMMDEWDHQPKRFAEVILCAASATYEDYGGNKFKATWNWELHPFIYRTWASRVRKGTDSWLPDTAGPYLTVSAIHTERVAQ